MEDHRILITGGAGLVGSHIADAAIRAGAREVRIFEQFTRGTLENLRWAMEHGNVTVVEGDVRDPSALAQATDGIDVVFHQAALRITLCAEAPRLAHEVMVDGTFNVAEAAVRAGVGKVVVASSASVYGMAEAFPTPEDHHPYGNRTLYGAAKAYNEALFRSFHEMSGLDYVALRYFNIYGPRMAIFGEHTEVLVRWMKRVEAGLPPLIFGDGTEIIDFVYVGDVVRANVLAATRPVVDEVFNVGSGVVTTLSELATTLVNVMGRDLEPEFAPARVVNPVPVRLADVTRARERLGFEAEVGLEEGLTRLVTWWRAERAAR
jgi:nucleoside-diphosphate-sugar epimerase